MAEFMIKPGADDVAAVYEGPFGPVELYQTPEPDLTITLRGPNLPESQVELGRYRWLPRRIMKTRNGRPFIARVGSVEVAIHNERTFCIPAFGRNPTLVAEAFDRRYTVPLREFGEWRVKRSDGSVVATVLKQRWIDDRSDALDVAIILLLRSVGVIYENSVSRAALIAGPAGSST